jgi:hypothetical protein
MRLTRLAVVVCLTSVAGFGESWSGWLVNSRCYDALESNKNPQDTSSYVDRDRGAEIEYCTPNAKTKFFAVVLVNDGERLTFDSVGNAMAAALVPKAGKSSFVRVEVMGQRKNNKIAVQSVSLAR